MLVKLVQFRYRWNNCKYNSRNYNCNQSCMPRYLYEHFSSFGHCEFLQHLSVMVIDRTDPSDPLKREDYWRRTLCGLDPQGRNIEDHVKSLISFTVFTTVQQLLCKYLLNVGRNYNRLLSKLRRLIFCICCKL